MLQKQGTKIDKVLNFAIDDAILEERITGRWIHPSSGRTYNTKFAPPKVPGVDDVSYFGFLGVFRPSYLVFDFLNSQNYLPFMADKKILSWGLTWETVWKPEREGLSMHSLNLYSLS